MSESVKKNAEPKVQIEGFGIKEIESLAEVTRDMAGSYFSAKPQKEGLTDWLGGELKKWVPGNLVVGMADDIMNGIDEFNQNLIELNSHCEKGKFKENWLRDKLREPMEGMDEKALSAGNLTLAAAIESEQGVMIHVDAILEEDAESSEKESIAWDRQMLGMVGTEIANQVNLTAAAFASSPDGALMALQSVEGDSLSSEDIAGMEIDSTLDKGLKAIAAGALNICSVTGKIPVLRNIATPVLTNVACVGVEGVKALAKFGQGKISATRTIEHIERAVTAGAVGIIRKGTELGKKLLSKLPIIGNTVGSAVATIVGKTVEKKAAQYIHQGIEKIKPIAKVALETAKTVVTKAVDTVKEVGKKVLSFFGF